MFDLILLQPEIPPNTGNIIRLCANSGARLHLIHPLGFKLEEKALRRAGLDYHEWASVSEYSSWEDYKNQHPKQRIFACSTKASLNHDQPSYQTGDGFLFGPESRGLPLDILNEFNEPQKIRIPMRAHSRSLNLSNAVSIILYEAWRQVGFE